MQIGVFSTKRYDRASLEAANADAAARGAGHELVFLEARLTSETASIAVSVRRLHDIDKTGWWILIGFIPIIGTIILLIFAFLPGTAGDNKYGADPKAAAAA